MEVKYAFFMWCFIVPFSTSSFVITIVFLFNKYLVIIQKVFYTARYYIVTSSFQMSSKFINFGPWVNIFGLPLFWCSWHIAVVVFYFEAALFMCSKNTWNIPRRNSFVNRSDILLWLFLSFSASCYLFWLCY